MEQLISKMQEHAQHIIGSLPFMILSTHDDGKVSVSFNWARIFEAVVIALIGGAFASYLMVRDLKLEVDHLKKLHESWSHRIENRLEQIDERVYQHTIINGGKNASR